MSVFTPITVGAPDGYPEGYLQAGGEPYGRTYDAANPEDAAELAAAMEFAEALDDMIDVTETALDAADPRSVASRISTAAGRWSGHRSIASARRART